MTPPEPDCPCATTELRTRTYRNGQKVYVRQCLTCGDGLSLPLKTASLSLRERLAAPPVDEGLRQRWYETLSERRREAYAAEREAESAEFWEWYDGYLHSEGWRRRSRATLKRDNHECQAQLEGCEERATQAHHLTYKRVGREPLFDLVAVCRSCHVRLHPEHGGAVPQW